MELFDRHEATELRDLFAAMDGAEETAARDAMAEAAVLLSEHELSFRHIVQEIDDRGLLLPTKVAAAIKLMDSTTMSEAASAFSGARRLMRACGLTFSGIIQALDREPVNTEDVQRLTLAYKLEMQRSRALQEEIHKLRANAATVAAAFASGAGAPMAPIITPAAPSPLRNFVVVTTLLLGVGLAASIASSFADMYRGNAATLPSPPARTAVLPGTVPGTVPPAAVPPAAAPRGNYPPYPGAPAPTVAARDTDPTPFSLSPPRAGWSCWRNRGNRGSCF
jgi:hypothetical protein